MLVDNKQIAIVGGGPGGLTLARFLQLKGVDVKVYERDFSREARLQGATLDLHAGSGLLAVEKAGLMDQFKKLYRPGADKGRIIDKHGNILYDEHNKPERTDEQEWRPEIDRSDLRDLLLDSLLPDTVIWDSHIVSADRVEEGWQLVFKNGSTVFADIIIGADGGNSKIRPIVTDATPYYASTTIFQGNVEEAEVRAPGVYDMLKGGKIYVHADGKYFHISSKGDGSIDFYISAKVPENSVKESGADFSDRSQFLNWCQENFNGWSKLWFELFENTTLPLLVRPQYCIPVDQSWEAQPDLTLLGDAAHIMPPSGEGVNLAMLDALELCECLTNEDFTDLKTAIETYEHRMRIRAAAEAVESMEGVEWMHGAEAQDKMLAFIS
ncbi:FAD-dependent oxidoreductase [Fulvivirga ligni]|uniref:FAD-dependent oxidoreductase n=1 Tax=Fulvivirga ligni TaxID=2904246 RepID=UPI001F30313C|nr:NAD(P)/FAD-dependent oxidoreductase [Fulvivirga ligni]UII21545.1 FAD-dependent monooxygenase [Fulvivirga ligni]